MPHVSFLRNHGKTSRTPRRPFEKERLDNEMKLIGEFGLKNKREVWRTQLTLARIRKAARVLLTLDEKDPRRIFEGGALLRCAAATGASLTPGGRICGCRQSTQLAPLLHTRRRIVPAPRDSTGRKRQSLVSVAAAAAAAAARCVVDCCGLLLLPVPLFSGGCFALACSTRASSSWITCLR